MRLTKKIFTDLYASPCDEDTEEKQAEQQWKICNKLGQLEDIEDELGIDLITLFKALKNGIYIKSYLDCYRVSKPIFDLLEQCLIDISESDHYSSNYEITKYYFKDYGKTWALTKEELL